MAPVKAKNANKMPDTSPNTSRKRKSDTSTTQEPSSTKPDAPAAKRARKAAPSKSELEPKLKPAAKENAPTRAAKPDTDKYDITGITLPGESTGTVPIYDTASDTRTKINAHTRTAPKTHSSNAALVRGFTASYPPHLLPSEGISARSLKTFLAKKGHTGGASMPIYYAAYVYFEKLRVRQDKKKTKKRLEMEETWGRAGVDRSADADVPMFMMVGERVAVDKHGHMNMVSKEGRVKKLT